MKIPYYITNVYGKPTAYIAVESVRHTLRMLTRRVTIDEMDLTALRELGHEPELVPAPIKLGKKIPIL